MVKVRHVENRYTAIVSRIDQRLPEARFGYKWVKPLSTEHNRTGTCVLYHQDYWEEIEGEKDGDHP